MVVMSELSMPEGPGVLPIGETGARYETLQAWEGQMPLSGAGLLDLFGRGLEGNGVMAGKQM
jgi:hypothetical protein